MRAEIEKIITSLGISESLLGYKYICLAVEMALDDEEIINNMIDRLYPAVATSYGKTASSVERAMRHAIFTSWNKGNRVICSAFEKKPDNFHLIRYIVNAVNRNCPM